MKKSVALASIFSLIGCGLNTSALNEYSHDYYIGDSIVDNTNAFGLTDIVPQNISQSQVQNLALIAELATVVGLLSLAEKYSDGNTLANLNREMNSAVLEQTKARELVSASERGHRIQQLQFAERSRVESIKGLDNSARLLSADREAIAAGKSGVIINMSEGRHLTPTQAIDQIDRDLRKIAADRLEIQAARKTANHELAQLLNAGNVLSDDVVTATRKAASKKVNDLRAKVAEQMMRKPGSGFRNAFRKIAIVGSIIVFVDFGARVYVLHGLNVKPGILAADDAVAVLGGKTMAWAAGKFDGYLKGDATNYIDEIKYAVGSNASEKK